MHGSHAPRSTVGDRGSQIVEFAITVPLLVVFAVGIYDFAQAFNVKEKLNFAAKDGARFGATQPTNDLSQNTPLSVMAIRDLVDADLFAQGMNDCGLSQIQQQSGLVWTATGQCQNNSTGTVTTLTLTIDRGFVTPPASAFEPWLISTRVSISYPYQWHFNSAIQLIAPGAGFAGTTPITIDAVALNHD
jgi:Flp pilus assembly protein TadG